jgi:sec-independent protein translocase protein TatC
MKVKDHLNELKKELYKIVIPSVILFFTFFALAKPMILFILNFYKIPLTSVVSLTPFESLQTSLMVAGSLTILFLLPLILNGMIRYSREAIGEKIYKATKNLIITSYSLAIFGFVVGLLLFSKFILTSLITDYTITTAQWSIYSVFSFIIISSISLAIAMQMIILIPMFVKIGLIKKETLKKIRPFAFIIVLITSAIITPTTDLISMGLMSLPIYGAYELGIMFSKTKLEDKEKC